MKKSKKMFLLASFAVILYGVYHKQSIVDYVAKITNSKDAASSVEKKDIATLENQRADSAGANQSEKTEVVEKLEETPAAPEYSEQGGVVEAENSKFIAEFHDGTGIEDSEIMKEVGMLSEQVSEKMTLGNLKSFLAWNKVYKKLLLSAAKEAGLDKNEEFRKDLKKRQDILVRLQLLEEESKKLMTDEVLEKYYDQNWDKEFKGTKSFSLVGVVTEDKKIAEDFKKTVVDEKSLKNMVALHKGRVKDMQLNNTSEKEFPEELSSAVLQQGENSVVGPFYVDGSYMLFFVQKIEAAKKSWFQGDAIEKYRNSVQPIFSQKYLKNLYDKFNVSIIDVYGKTIDPFKIVEKDEKARKKTSDKAVDLRKIEDTQVFAKFADGQTITAKNIKDYFEFDSLENQSFSEMAKSFGITEQEIVSYAVKLMCDNSVLDMEIKELNFQQKPSVLKKLESLENISLERKFFKEKVVVNDNDIKASYEKFLDLVGRDEKFSKISAKIVMFDNESEAKAALKMIISGGEKFNNIFSKKSENQYAKDIGYVEKQSSSKNLWSMLKTSNSATCCKDILKLNGEKFGIQGQYAIVYVGEKVQLVLPDLANKEIKEKFAQIAQKEKAFELVKAMFVQQVKSIGGIEISADDEKMHSMLNAMIVLN